MPLGPDNSRSGASVDRRVSRPRWYGTPVPAPWQSTADVFGQVLRRHGLDPSAVTDVAEAWAAFAEFLQIEVDGILSPVDQDGDGFIVQWGRSSWNGYRPSLSFTRQLAIPDAEDPAWQPSYWQLDLAMTFEDQPGLAGLDELNESDTGFSFTPVGPERAAELTEMHKHYLGLYPQLQAMWNAKPITTELTMYQAD